MVGFDYNDEAIVYCNNLNIDKFPTQVQEEHSVVLSMIQCTGHSLTF